MTRIFPVLAAVLLALSANTAAAGVFNPDTFTLENGMRVVVIENPRVPVVTHMVWYSVGSADEGPGESGIAHVLEHLMFKGTKKRQPGEFSKILARNGGQENAFTSSDYTAYFQTVAADRLEMVMEMEADRMTNLVLTGDSVETEKKVIMEERRSRTDNNPSGILAEQANAALYLNYPYRRPVIGWAHEIKALSRENILAFYKKWYAPENAILVVAGDITAEKLKPLAEKYYGVIPRGPGVKRLRPKEPPQKAMRRVTLKDKRVRQAAWSRTYLAPSYLYGASEHAYALQVLSGIFGGGSSSRLYRALVIDNKIAVTAGSHYGAGNRGPSGFSVQASPRPGVTMTELEKRIEDELVKLLKDGVTESEVKRVIKRMQARSIYARDSQSGGARALGAALATGLDVDDVESWPDRIGAVTVDAVNKAARYVLREGRSVTSLLLPKKTG